MNAHYFPRGKLQILNRTAIILHYAISLILIQHTKLHTGWSFNIKSQTLPFLAWNSVSKVTQLFLGSHSLKKENYSI